MKKILLIKTSSMGDLIHTFPALTDLEQYFTQRNERFSLTWVVEESFQEIPTLHPATYSIIPVALRRWRKALFSPSTWREYRQFKKAIKAEKWDYVIDAQGLLKSVFLARKAKRPIHGFDKESIREKSAARFNHYQYPVSWKIGAIPRTRLLFAQIFGYSFDEDLIDFGLPLPNPPLPNLSLPKTIHPLIPNQPFVALIHGTSAESKEWAEENWVKLGTWLLEKKGLISLLFWGNQREKKRAERLHNAIPQSIIIPRLSLKESSQIIAQSTLVIAVDTGFAHLANAYERPLVMLFSDSKPTHAGAVLTSHNTKVINLGDIGKAPNVNHVTEALSHFKD